MPGDVSESVHGHAGVGRPGQPRMAQTVSLQLLLAKLCDDFVPRHGVTQGGGGDTSASWACEESSIRIMICVLNVPLNEVANGVELAGRKLSAPPGRIVA